jgi:hypothetical protein
MIGGRRLKLSMACSKQMKTGLTRFPELNDMSFMLTSWHGVACPPTTAPHYHKAGQIADFCYQLRYW